MKVSVTCPCGEDFTAAPWELKRKYPTKYCSANCMYEFRVKKTNSGCFKSGERRSPETEFKKGQIPHNFNEEVTRYDTLHTWVIHRKGKASTYQCKCDKQAQDWANLSWEYKRDLEDWEPMCKKCHREYDMNGNWGAATRMFPELTNRKKRA